MRRLPPRKPVQSTKEPPAMPAVHTSPSLATRPAEAYICRKCGHTGLGTKGSNLLNNRRKCSMCQSRDLAPCMVVPIAS